MAISTKPVQLKDAAAVSAFRALNKINADGLDKSKLNGSTPAELARNISAEFSYKFEKAFQAELEQQLLKELKASANDAIVEDQLN